MRLQLVSPYSLVAKKPRLWGREEMTLIRPAAAPWWISRDVRFSRKSDLLVSSNARDADAKQQDQNPLPCILA